MIAFPSAFQILFCYCQVHFKFMQLNCLLGPGEYRKSCVIWKIKKKISQVILDDICSLCFNLILCLNGFDLYCTQWYCVQWPKMRAKARGLALNGGPPGGLEESDPAGCDFVRDRRSMPAALTEHTMHLHIWYITKSTQNTAMRYVTQGRHGLAL
jgi:hypothetical protein